MTWVKPNERAEGEEGNRGGRERGAEREKEELAEKRTRRATELAIGAIEKMAADVLEDRDGKEYVDAGTANRAIRIAVVFGIAGRPAWERGNKRDRWGELAAMEKADTKKPSESQTDRLFVAAAYRMLVKGINQESYSVESMAAEAEAACKALEAELGKGAWGEFVKHAEREIPEKKKATAEGAEKTQRTERGKEDKKDLAQRRKDAKGETKEAKRETAGAEWREGDELSEALIQKCVDRALHGFSDADKKIEALKKKKKITDAQVRELASELIGTGGSSAPGMPTLSFKGGKNPRVIIGVKVGMAKGGLEIQGAELVARVRRLWNISGPGICRYCGCTDEEGCPEGCSWANEGETVCSSCVGQAGEEDKLLAEFEGERR